MRDYDMIRFNQILANYNAPLSQEDLEPLELTLDIPGVEKEDVAVNILNDIISIKVEGYAPIQQRISKTVDRGTIRATLRNGRLRIEGDLHEKAKPREIEVKIDEE